LAFVRVYAKEGIDLKKDSTRDYITAAFRLYAALHCPTESEISSMHIVDERTTIAVKLDLIAVYQTMKDLDSSGKNYICKAIEAIYFVEPKRPLKKGEIDSRALSFAMSNYVDKRTVWRWLKEARQLCALHRGLNIAPIEEIID
jgi:hypothetical protein